MKAALCYALATEDNRVKKPIRQYRRLRRRLLDSESFANAADLVAADRSRMIAPVAADKTEHIRHFRVAQAPPEIRHGERGRRGLS